MGEAARLKPLEVELKRLEDLSEAIVQDFAYMRQREEEMRDTNGNFLNIHVLLRFDFYIYLFFFRINKFPSIVFQRAQHAVPNCSGHMAGSLSASIFQGQKADRVIRTVFKFIKSEVVKEMCKKSHQQITAQLLLTNFYQPL